MYQLAINAIATVARFTVAGIYIARARSMSAHRKGTDMTDDLQAARGITWAVLLSAVLWILAGAGFWALVVHWGWRQ